jgi:hypothetical protein
MVFVTGVVFKRLHLCTYPYLRLKTLWLTCASCTGIQSPMEIEEVHAWHLRPSVFWAVQKREPKVIKKKLRFFFERDNAFERKRVKKRN